MEANMLVVHSALRNVPFSLDTWIGAFRPVLLFGVRVMAAGNRRVFCSRAAVLRYIRYAFCLFLFWTKGNYSTSEKKASFGCKCSVYFRLIEKLVGFCSWARKTVTSTRHACMIVEENYH
jgi:hypothetical protein